MWPKLNIYEGEYVNVCWQVWAGKQALLGHAVEFSPPYFIPKQAKRAHCHFPEPLRIADIMYSNPPNNLSVKTLHSSRLTLPSHPKLWHHAI